MTIPQAARRGRALRGALPLAAASALALAGCHGCEGCARGRGAPGSTPIEQVAPRATAIATPLPDPCRGLALPADGHFVAAGLCARAVGVHQGQIRQLTFAPNGDLFAVTIDGVLRRYRDRDGDGFFAREEIVEWAKTGGDNGHGVSFDAAGGYLYAGSQEGVKRWKYSPDLDRGGEGEDVLVGQPGGGNHPYHPVQIYDGFMYVDSGSERNSMDPMPDDYDTERSVIKRFALSRFVAGIPFRWSEGEIFVRGARNVTGFARDGKGRMFGVLSGLDDLRYDGADVHADNPGDELVSLEQGDAFGYPYCFPAVRIVRDGRVVPPGTRLRADVVSQNPLSAAVWSSRDDAWCGAHAKAPLSLIQAHASALGVVFFEGPRGVLPERYRGGAFVTLHGSWDRTPSTGNKVIWIPFDEAGRAPMPTSTAESTTFPYETVFGGGREGEPRDGAWGWSASFHGEHGSEEVGEDVVRPVGVAISPIDGALYVSSDNGRVPLTHLGVRADGVLYRIGLSR